MKPIIDVIGFRKKSTAKNFVKIGDNMKYEIPIWRKTNLTVDEASAYSNIGTDKIRKISNDEDCPFVLWCGSKRLIKRKLFDKYLEEVYSL